jgi:uncharacterized tellurite resistance protein B-like protein
MLDHLRHLVQDSLPGTPGRHSRLHPHDVRIAACALLLELAYVDGYFSALERSRITGMLRRWFGVHEADAERLLAEAASARRDASDPFVFTERLVEAYDVGQRTVVAELLWEVAHADGVLEAEEHALIAQLSSALALDPALLARTREGGEPAPPAAGDTSA